jgi:6-phosphogluconolactonase
MEVLDNNVWPRLDLILGEKTYKSNRLRIFVIVALALLVAGTYWMSLPGRQPPGTNYRVYIGTITSQDGKGIYLYNLDATGKMEAVGLASGGRLWQSKSVPLARVPVRVLGQIRADWPDVTTMVMGVHDPMNLAVHPNGHYLYTANPQTIGTVSAFRIDRESGRLARLNTEFSGGETPAFLAVDHTGNFLLVANYGGSVAVLPIDPDGRLRPATTVIQQGEIEMLLAHSSHAHAMVLSPDNRFAIVPDIGLDRVFVYKFDATRGELTPNHPAFVSAPTGGAPRHFIFHPNGQFGYAIGESGSCVMAMRWDAQRGVLTAIQTISTLPPDFHKGNAGADLSIDPSGQFLYASNRGHDSIAVFAIDSATGKLTSVQIEPSYGSRPSNLLMSPDGNYLFAANVASNNVVRFHIDRQTGRLNPIESFGIPSPMAMVLWPPG